MNLTAAPTAPSDLPPPGEPASRASVAVGRVVTGLFVIGPAVILAVALVFLWGHAINLADVILFVALYLLAGFGISVGYHRHFTHRSFTPNRWLKLALAGAGLALIETVLAKLRLFLAPEFLSTAFLLAVLGMLTHFLLLT